MSGPGSEGPTTSYDRLVGHRFPGGRYTLPAYVAWLWSDTVLAEPDPDVAHPGLAYFIALQGMGVTIQDVFDLMDATADSGVMFGEQKLDFAGALRPGTTYDVQARIVDVVRKEGKRAGVFDRLTFEVTLVQDGAAEPTARATSTWIFPRREAQA